MADAKQPPTETTQETVIIKEGTAGMQTNVKVVPCKFGNYRIQMDQGTVPRELAGLYSEYALAEAAIKTHYSNAIARTDDLESFIDPKLKEQLKKRKAERSAQSPS